jgi:hypothetical protein
MFAFFGRRISLVRMLSPAEKLLHSPVCMPAEYGQKLLLNH